MLVLVVLSAPCLASSSLDQGSKAPCDGVLISADRARQAIADKRELNLRTTFECDPCPAPKKDETAAIATASFFSGFVLGLLLFVIR